jgi:hypothetical protein
VLRSFKPLNLIDLKIILYQILAIFPNGSSAQTFAGTYRPCRSFQEQPAGRQVADRQYNPNLTLRECGLSEAD